MELRTPLADPESDTLEDLVDLDAYPIHLPRSARLTELVDEARVRLAADGCVRLPGFLRREVLESARTEVAALAPKAVFQRGRSSVYARPASERDLTRDDPRRWSFPRSVGYLTRDQIGPDAAIARVYVAPAFKAFVGACTGAGRVFEYADPLAGLIVTVLQPGGELSWHYDTNKLVVTLMTQAPEAGGVFEYVPGLRRPGDENIEGLRRVVGGEAPDMVRTAPFAAGDVQLFLGRYSLHRVTRVLGGRARHVAALGYADRPGVIGPVERTRALYGRVTEAHLLHRELGEHATDGLIL